MEAPSEPRFSIVMPTRRGWNEVVRRTYQGIREQSLAHGAEVLIMDGIGRPPPEGEVADNVRWIVRPSESVHQLRVAGYREARGEIVACTEDHAVPSPDWLDAMGRAWDEWPEAAGIGGCAINGDDAHGVDRASFYAGHAAMMPPLPRGEATAISAMNLSYRRDALAEVLGPPTEVAVDQVLQTRLLKRGRKLVTDDRIRSVHHQAMSVLDTAIIHFHNGRSFTSLRQRLDPRDAWLRAARSAVVVGPRTARRLRTAHSRGEPMAKLVATLPYLFWVLSAQAAGEILGSVAGPGDSPSKLH